MSYFLHNNPFGGIIVLYDDGGGGVVINPVSVVINETISSLNVGDTGSLTATVSYSDSSQVNSADTPSVVNWSSSDESKLTIDSYGNYMTLNTGDVTVTAASSENNSITDEIFINITSSTIEIEIGEGGLQTGYSKAAGYGDLISGEFPNGDEINVCMVIGVDTGISSNLRSVNSLKWSDLDALTMTFVFEDETEVTTNTMYWSGTDSMKFNPRATIGYYSSVEPQLDVYNAVQSRVGQTAKVLIAEASIEALVGKDKAK
ncbi:Ig-like domain-containing protein [Vibrio parahaemolyticus]|uniref:Ig-like domain-containing protein n=3 Tax=Vibrio parahaemolyticus TaxID=670 RepID=UPI00112189C6|nr:Ig-like domain-containing protein [Vibrio parahaemolyticus]MBE4801873.1 hypothetical protein [Vibrio parahaemolyticus]MDF4269046.1 Ig-like domain-containing protein [Vibrio parahaemolyticus]MDF4274294.1 Ig-like domain-containing protein [Vibrio parahaemolyticus]MDF4298975.1 Ig-like domain-containing protein [Vibrio parahaemolyticus]MDF4619740.1 Ig-like domain-containing protein [Vibrio parahaemolyticus]